MPGTFLSAGVHHFKPKSILMKLIQWEEADYNETNYDIRGAKNVVEKNKAARGIKNDSGAGVAVRAQNVCVK